MIKGVIRLGDKLSHGGQVTEATGEMFDGKPVMLLGDSARCNLHGKTKADEGHPTWTMHGRNVVTEEYQAKCGCSFISSLPVAGAR
ncbi:PAAR domain-containing protein [Pantoea sp. At-9b]|uniref:PAAR domain-containing protein n=1 Tax=Pantoea sp. (strain At-9b) TaxID=592316 RepID=UPI0001B3F453|nr:PAAR domain-containing protein [Pantoea sp. At-9b]ADU71307.1 conserved hypothetical protein [Pantoea sp. At-9b]